jgi:hypothetical protein
VAVNVQARSIAFAANELNRILLETTVARGLPLNYLHFRQQDLADGFRTWMSGRWLEGVILEIYDPVSDKLMEKFHLDIAYTTDGNSDETYKTHIEKLQTELKRLKKLQPGCRYRVLADTSSNAPMLPGWTESKLRDAGHLSRQEFGGMVDTAGISIGMTYFGERSNAQCT